MPVRAGEIADSWRLGRGVEPREFTRPTRRRTGHRAADARGHPHGATRGRGAELIRAAGAGLTAGARAEGGACQRPASLHASERRALDKLEPRRAPCINICIVGGAFVMGHPVSTYRVRTARRPPRIQISPLAVGALRVTAGHLRAGDWAGPPVWRGALITLPVPNVYAGRGAGAKHVLASR